MQFDLDPIRGILDRGDPIPPWIVRRLIARVEAAEADVRAWARFAARVADDLDNHGNRDEIIGAIRDAVARQEASQP